LRQQSEKMFLLVLSEKKINQARDFENEQNKQQSKDFLLGCENQSGQAKQTANQNFAWIFVWVC